MKKLLILTGMLALATQSITGVVAAESNVKAPDGTVVMDVYPDDPQTKNVKLEKEKLITMFEEAKQGKRSKKEVDQAVLAFEKKFGMKKNSNVESSMVSNSIIEPDVVYPASASISNAYQYSQTTNYYCGPSTAKTILGPLVSTSYTQDQLATSLGTTIDGTAWYDGVKYPMASALNAKLGTTTYYASAAPTLSTMKSAIQFDIYYGYPMAANVVEVANGYHLPGHPSSQTIYHWVAIKGYTTNADNSTIADPASNGTGISWGSSVPAYSTISTSSLQGLTSSRGIIK